MDKRQYLDELENRCGKEADFFYVRDNQVDPQIGVIGFDNYPKKGLHTYFSYGLHLLNRKEWKLARPEYFLVIDNDNREFAMFFAYVLSAFAPEKIMAWATLIGIDDGDAVDGYPYRRIALGPPQYLEWPAYEIEDKGALPISLGMAYLMNNKDFSRAASAGFGYLEDKMRDDHEYWHRLQHG